MMQKNIIIFIVFLCTISCKKDNDKLLKVGDFRFENVTDLPTIIKESSGLEVAAADKFWSFNDSGGAAELYQFDTLGNLIKTLKITNITNHDWEDITEDADGNLYIGDFGNNENARQDLAIYKITKDDLDSNNNSVSAARIEFSYPEQIAFPPDESERLFDAEGLFANGEFLYILTKDRSKPFIGKTSLYRVPNIEGIYEAVFLSEFFTDEDEVKGQITAADLSPDGATFAMISSETIYLFQNLTEENVFTGDLLKLNFPIQLDFEAMVFLDDCNIYLSNEKNSNGDGGLYRISICE